MGKGVHVSSFLKRAGLTRTSHEMQVSAFELLV